MHLHAAEKNSCIHKKLFIYLAVYLLICHSINTMVFTVVTSSQAVLTGCKSPVLITWQQHHT